MDRNLMRPLPGKGVHLVVNAEFHDDTLAEQQLRAQLAALPGVRVQRGRGFGDIDWAATTLLVTYTLNVFPHDSERERLARFVERGGRWLAVHASATATEFQPPPYRAGPVLLPGRTATPDIHGEYLSLIGARMLAHLPMGRFPVIPTRRTHPITEKMAPFEAHDEQFIVSVLDPSVQVLLESRYVGESPGYVRGPWLADEPRPIMTSRRLGVGEVIFLALGHATAADSLRPYADAVVPTAGSWFEPGFRDLLARCLRWGVGTPG